MRSNRSRACSRTAPKGRQSIAQGVSPGKTGSSAFCASPEGATVTPKPTLLPPLRGSGDRLAKHPQGSRPGLLAVAPSGLSTVEPSGLLEETGDPHRVRRLRRRPLGRYRYVRLRWRVLFAMIDFLGTALFGGARTLRRCLRGPAPNRLDPPRDPKVILLVQLDHLGDAVLTTAMLPPLRSRWPNASIEVLAGASNRELFEAVAEVDRVHVSKVNRFARGRLTRFAWIPATLWWGWKLRRRKVDLAIDVRGDFPVAVILWLCGARRRLGWACGGGRFLLSDTARFVPHRPEVESRLALLAKLGIRPKKGIRPFFASTSLDGATCLRAKKGPVPFSSFSRLVVAHVGAGTPAKAWPVEHWRELLGRIAVGGGAELVLVGGGKDRIIAGQILGGRPGPAVENRTGRLSVVELAALLRRADVFVGADSGPAHLAAAVGTPVVVLFSGTNHPQQWQPCGEHVTVVRRVVDCSPCHRERCPLADHPCMSGLGAKQVFAAVEKTLREMPHGRVERSEAAEKQIPQEL